MTQHSCQLLRKVCVQLRAESPSGARHARRESSRSPSALRVSSRSLPRHALLTCVSSRRSPLWAALRRHAARWLRACRLSWWASRKKLRRAPRRELVRRACACRVVAASARVLRSAALLARCSGAASGATWAPRVCSWCFVPCAQPRGTRSRGAACALLDCAVTSQGHCVRRRRRRLALPSRCG